MSAMSSSWTKPQGPVAQLLALAMAIPPGFVVESDSDATRSAKWRGLLTLAGLIGDRPCLEVTMNSVELWRFWCLGGPVNMPSARLGLTSANGSKGVGNLVG